MTGAGPTAPFRFRKSAISNPPTLYRGNQPRAGSRRDACLLAPTTPLKSDQLRMSQPKVDEILARLLTLHPKRIDLSLDRMWHVLERLGHPEKNLPPVIHVAGTNGKGSTIAFMRAMLEAAGARAHVYTSPNLVRMNERFRLGQPGGGVLVSDADLVAALETSERANGDAPITVFEIETAAAFMLFADHPADVLLLDV